MSPMPRQKPGKSKQDYETPEVFLNALRKKLQIRNFTIDLAATAANTVTKRFISPEQDSLIQPWDTGMGWGWLNSEFNNMRPWVTKSNGAKARGQRVAQLVPASVGSNWWAEEVHGHAQVLFLNGRIQFVGHTQPYPKDLALLLYAHDWPARYCIWRWMDA